MMYERMRCSKFTLGGQTKEGMAKMTNAICPGVRVSDELTSSARWFFFSSRRRHTRYIGDWSSDVCSSDLVPDDELSLAARFIDHWRAITLGLGRQRFPQLFAGILMEGDHDAAFAAYQADQFFEIGRASCRERVEVSGSGVSFKSKSSKLE